jgi:hypothetical protein
MGSPEYLKPAEVDILMQASMPVPEPATHKIAAGAVEFELTLEPQSVNHVRIEWEAAV